MFPPLVFTAFPSCRSILAFMSFLGFINVYCLRVNLSVALVEMVNGTAEAENNNGSSGRHTDNTCPRADNSSADDHKVTV